MLLGLFLSDYVTCFWSGTRPFLRASGRKEPPRLLCPNSLYCWAGRPAHRINLLPSSLLLAGPAEGQLLRWEQGCCCLWASSPWVFACLALPAGQPWSGTKWHQNPAPHFQYHSPLYKGWQESSTFWCWEACLVFGPYAPHTAQPFLFFMADQLHGIIGELNYEGRRWVVFKSLHLFCTAVCPYFFWQAAAEQPHRKMEK